VSIAGRWVGIVEPPEAPPSCSSSAQPLPDPDRKKDTRRNSRRDKSNRSIPDIRNNRDSRSLPNILDRGRVRSRIRSVRTRIQSLFHIRPQTRGRNHHGRSRRCHLENHRQSRHRRHYGIHRHRRHGIRHHHRRRATRRVARMRRSMPTREINKPEGSSLESLLFRT
jgi:hypothetical protein